jgi:hypothetical protein
VHSDELSARPGIESGHRRFHRRGPNHDHHVRSTGIAAIDLLARPKDLLGTYSDHLQTDRQHRGLCLETSQFRPKRLRSSDRRPDSTLKFYPPTQPFFSVLGTLQQTALDPRIWNETRLPISELGVATENSFTVPASVIA